MENSESLVGKWGVYYLSKGCCSGYGLIVKASEWTVSIDENPGGIIITTVSRSNTKVFDTQEEARVYFHEEAKKRSCRTGIGGKEDCTGLCQVF